MQLILASTSRYRQAALAKLGLSFDCVSPDVDETPLAGESPAALCLRLSLAKARAVAARAQDALVIGSDQVAEHRGQIIGKPGNRARNVAQLTAFSAERVCFHSGIALIHASSGEAQTHIDVTEVIFRPLSAAQIEHYLDREPAFDCAGGFKCEGLGIALFEAIRSEDPSALIGLPLIALSRMLARFGMDPLAARGAPINAPTHADG